MGGACWHGPGESVTRGDRWPRELGDSKSIAVAPLRLPTYGIGHSLNLGKRRFAPAIVRSYTMAVRYESERMSAFVGIRSKCHFHGI